MGWHVEWMVAQIIELHSSFQSIDELEYIPICQVTLHILSKLFAALFDEHITLHVLIHCS